MGLAGEVDPADVAEHARLVRQAGKGADALQLVLRPGDEILVPELQVAPGADPPPERARGGDLGPPLAREALGVAWVAPALGDDPRRHREERERGVAAVADEMDEACGREEALEQREVLHVHRCLVPPAGLALEGGVRLEDRADRLARGHPRPQPCGHVVEREAPLPERRQPPQIVEERVGIDGAPVPAGQLWNEVRLVGDRDRAVAVEHHAQQRRPRAANAEDEERGPAHFGGSTCTIALSACPSRLDEEREGAGRPGRAQNEQARRVRARPACEPPGEAKRVGHDADAEALAGLDGDLGPRELDVADPDRNGRRGRRRVSRPIDRDDRDRVRARPERASVPPAEPVERSLERHAAAQHPLLPVHEQSHPGALGHRVVDADPVAAAVAVRREDGRVHRPDRDHGLRRVDPDRVRKHDRAPVGLEPDPRPVHRVRDDVPVVVASVPVQGQAPDPLVLVLDERPHAVVSPSRADRP